jgi:hypothetical protein
MTSYSVHLETVASFSVTVEAEDAEDAIEQAFDLTPSGVCAHCSGWGKKWSMDLGEWDVCAEMPPIVEDES